MPRSDDDAVVVCSAKAEATLTCWDSVEIPVIGGPGKVKAALSMIAVNRGAPKHEAVAR